MVIDDVVSPDIYSPSDFPRFYSEFHSLSFLFIPYYRSHRKRKWAEMNSWKVLRLVCQSWATIVDPLQTPYLYLEDQGQSRNISNIRTLQVVDNAEWRDFNIKEYPLRQALLITGSTITTLVLYKDFYLTSAMAGFIVLILDHPQHFPSLRSLSIKGYSPLDSWFWSSLEKGYPKLTHLGIPDGFQSVGCVNLPNLTSLVLGITQLETSFVIPSLKHLHLFLYEDSMDYVTQLIRQNGAGIHSLAIWTHIRSPLVCSDIIDHCPNLRTFGASVTLLHDIWRRCSTQSTHTEYCTCHFEHLWLLDGPNVTAAVVDTIVKECKSLKLLTLNLPTHFAHLIQWKCKRNDIELVDSSAWINLE